MPPRRSTRKPAPPVQATDYRHDESRLNNPPAGLADLHPIPSGRKRYQFDPRLDPQLQWAGKAEHLTFDVETVPLHTHERISPAAILETLRTGPVQRSLFADPEFDLNQAVEFYQHPQPWANRLVLGDSLLVMNSLLEREVMAGKVQCIYFDPPYGIKYGSNFQPFTNKRDVKDADDGSLTREPEQIRAFRDTWELGVHSYLTYLRDRLLLMRELLTESGSIFVQISDENVHRVRCLMDEVFGGGNFITTITYKKPGQRASEYLPVLTDFILWYAKYRERMKYYQLYTPKSLAGDGGSHYTQVELVDGSIRSITMEERIIPENLPSGAKVFETTALTSAGSQSGVGKFVFKGNPYYPPSHKHWSASWPVGMDRLAKAGRIVEAGTSVRFKRYFDDFAPMTLDNRWEDVGLFGASLYIVQTSLNAVQRCILMTTDPGDLVFDPTCGSGTTAYVAEQWGRRWITCDTSRVALALARQRLMTATFPFYKLAYPEQGVRGAFVYKTVPHIMLSSISNNAEIDTIHARYHEQLEPLRTQLNQKLGQSWEEWQIPREAATTWPEEVQRLHAEWLRLRHERQQEIDKSIARNAETETLYDQPEVERSTIRVSGPFTVEAVQPPTVDPDAVETQAPASPDDAGSYLDRMTEQLRRGGLTVRNEHILITRISPLVGGVLHAECDYEQAGKTVRAAVIFGPQYGPLTSVQLQDALNEARGSYDALIAAAFVFDDQAHALMQKATLRPPVLGVAINADLLAGNLLKTSKSSQVFSVFGKPDVQISPPGPEGYTVTVRGVDIYDPNTGEFDASSAEQIAAWFLDTDYDGATFLVRQAYFPAQTPNPWEKISKALKGTIDTEQFAALQRTTSLPFKAGQHKQCAVKVIDHRGNEVMTVLRLQ